MLFKAEKKLFLQLLKQFFCCCFLVPWGCYSSNCQSGSYFPHVVPNCPAAHTELTFSLVLSWAIQPGEMKNVLAWCAVKQPLLLLCVSFEFIQSDRATVLASNLLGCGVLCCQSGVSQLNGQLWSSSASCLAPTQQNNYSCHVEWLASVGGVFPFSSILAHLQHVHAARN